MRMGKLGYRKREPIELPRKEPSLFRELLQFHTDDLGYDQAERAVLLAEQDLARLAGGSESPQLRLIK
jgi:hypothetical protein